MILKCKQEALNEKGEKIMNFTKGFSYECTKVDYEVWDVKDDKGEFEEFYDLTVMFTLP